MTNKSFRFQLEMRRRITINIDPQRRCYNGVNAKDSTVWTNWDWLELDVKKEKIKERLKFWQELNKYSISVGGKLCQYRITKVY